MYEATTHQYSTFSTGWGAWPPADRGVAAGRSSFSDQFHTERVATPCFLQTQRPVPGCCSSFIRDVESHLPLQRQSHRLRNIQHT
jgi:hypothetical protein